MENNKMLIDPEPLKQQIQDCIHQCYQLRIDSVGLLAMLLDYIKDAPCIEAKEVVHGHWTPVYDEEDLADGINYIVAYSCSACNGHVGWLHDHYNYCPNCGARMDGGIEND